MLEALHLYHNEINTIIPDTFDGLIILEELDLRHCGLMYILPVEFQSMKNIKIIRLYGNQIAMNFPFNLVNLSVIDYFEFTIKLNR